MPNTEQEERRIEEIACPHDDADPLPRFWKVGVDGVSEIKAIKKPGQMSSVIWYEVYWGGHLAFEANGAMLEYIKYEDPLGHIPF